MRPHVMLIQTGKLGNQGPSTLERQKVRVCVFSFRSYPGTSFLYLSKDTTLQSKGFNTFLQLFRPGRYNYHYFRPVVRCNVSDDYLFAVQCI